MKCLSIQVIELDCRQNWNGEVEVGTGIECNDDVDRVGRDVLVSLRLRRPDSQPEWQVRVV